MAKAAKWVGLICPAITVSVNVIEISSRLAATTGRPRRRMLADSCRNFWRRLVELIEHVTRLPEAEASAAV